MGFALTGSRHDQTCITDTYLQQKTRSVAAQAYGQGNLNRTSSTSRQMDADDVRAGQANQKLTAM
jgi:hypothetical protein